MREVDRLASRDGWDDVLALRDACLAATEETGRQLWGPARYAAYRTALDGPADLAAAMPEPGVVRFGLGPLTEVVAQHHTFAQLAPHLDSTLLPVVAQERVLRGEDLRDDPRAQGEADDPPLVLQPFEPHYVLPEYRAAERLDGELPEVTLSTPLGTTLGTALVTGEASSDADALALQRALEDVVAPWAAQSGGVARVVAVRGSVDQACRTVLEGLEALEGLEGGEGFDAPAADILAGTLDVPAMMRLVAFAGASGGVHGRRRGGAAGRAHAWWVARCATGLHREDLVDLEELEFRLEDLRILAFHAPRAAAWRLELAVGRDEQSSGREWAVAVAAFDAAEATERMTEQLTEQPPERSGVDASEAVPQDGAGTASW